MQYSSYKYIFPPRPDIICPPSNIKIFDDNYIAQPKLNGSCALLFTNGNDVQFMNRHAAELQCKIPWSELIVMNQRNTGWSVFVGEYMNKSKLDINGNKFNDKFVIFDVLVWDGNYLVNTNIIDRLNYIFKNFNLTPYDPSISRITNNIFITNTIYEKFDIVYKNIITVDMYEGLVFKKISGLLQPGWNKNNNTSWQAKVRKETKNYNY